MATILITTTARIAGGPNPGEPWEVDRQYGLHLIGLGKAKDASSLRNRLGGRAKRAAQAGARASILDREALRSDLATVVSDELEDLFTAASAPTPAPKAASQPAPVAPVERAKDEPAKVDRKP